MGATSSRDGPSQPVELLYASCARFKKAPHISFFLFFFGYLLYFQSVNCDLHIPRLEFQLPISRILRKKNDESKSNLIFTHLEGRSSQSSEKQVVLINGLTSLILTCKAFEVEHRLSCR